MAASSEKIEKIARSQKIARSEKISYGITAIASLIGLGDSVYLTVQHLTGRSVRCTIVSGCSAVLSSRYSMIGGLPTAAWGALAYFAAFSCTVLVLSGFRPALAPLRLIAAAMFVTTLWLFYLQAMVIRSFCSYCLLSALSTTLIVGALVVAGRSQNG